MQESPQPSLNRHRPNVTNANNTTYANNMTHNMGINTTSQYQANGDSSRTGELLREYHQKQKLRSDNGVVVNSSNKDTLPQQPQQQQQQQPVRGKQYMQAGDG